MFRRMLMAIASLVILAAMMSPAFAHHQGTPQDPPPDYSKWQKRVLSQKIEQASGETIDRIVYIDGANNVYKNIVVEATETRDGRTVKSFWWVEVVSRNDAGVVNNAVARLYAYEPGVGQFNGYYMFMGGPVSGKNLIDLLERMLK